MKIMLSNYRPIRANRAVALDLSRQITFLLGRNNCGKTSLLRFFSEFRPLFDWQVDMRKSQEREIDLGHLHWDSICHRDTPGHPLIFRVEFQGSVWEYSMRYAGLAQHTTKLHVQFSPVNNQDNNAVIEANHVFRRMLYFGPLRSTTFSGFGGPAQAITGSSFITSWAEWSTGKEPAKRAAAKLLEREIRDLFKFQEFSIKVNPERNELMVDYDDGSFRLSELGEGLSHFIVVLANALISKPSYILIDEPENGLHPKLQSMFVQTLASKTSHGLVAASHSLALGRHVADSVLYCKKDAAGFSVTEHGGVTTPTLVAEIREMGYSQYIEADAQNLLLVEGRTDIKAFREILRIYGIDQRFIIVSLSGSEFLAGDPHKYESELQELKALGTRSVTAIIDSEKATAADTIAPGRLKFCEVCEKLGYETHILERRSLENYFSAPAIHAVTGVSASLDPFDKFVESRAWKKPQNWRIAGRLTKEELLMTDLGQFVEKRLVPLATI